MFSLIKLCIYLVILIIFYILLGCAKLLAKASCFDFHQKQPSIFYVDDIQNRINIFSNMINYTRLYCPYLDVEVNSDEEFIFAVELYCLYCAFLISIISSSRINKKFIEEFVEEVLFYGRSNEQYSSYVYLQNRFLNKISLKYIIENRIDKYVPLLTGEDMLDSTTLAVSVLLKLAEQIKLFYFEDLKLKNPNVDIKSLRREIVNTPLSRECIVILLDVAQVTAKGYFQAIQKLLNNL